LKAGDIAHKNIGDSNMTTPTDHRQDMAGLLTSLGLTLPDVPASDVTTLDVRTPIDGSLLARWPVSSVAHVQATAEQAHQAFLRWRLCPAPQRGQVVRLFGDKVRQHKAALGRIVSLETGKILSEGLGEVQEVVDICEFAVGLSRQLQGLTLPSERAQHKLLETWHPLGVVGIISAFNFPMAVWAWNASLALVCGNTLVWKPSEKTPLSAWALHHLMEQALVECGHSIAGISSVVWGGRELGAALVDATEVKLVSATGSTAMGRAVAQACAPSFKRSLLELGGNNAAIVCPSADLDLVVRAVTFSAAGTAGQRCTSLRRLFVHRSLYRALIDRLITVFARLPVGNPLDDGVLVGPLIDAAALARMQHSLGRAREVGAVVHGGQQLPVSGQGACYVQPALIEMPRHTGPMREETFAPILYAMPYDHFDEAIALNNESAHGLSSAVFTNDLREAETFTASSGSDCGIANVNIGTSGAEIGGAFGGEKDTGGGRESGSDSWKAYMRRATNTINYGRDLPLAQGVRFEV
jgi:aldehyde dehydrogenase (NAD+)